MSKNHGKNKLTLEEKENLKVLFGLIGMAAGLIFAAGCFVYLVASMAWA